MRPIEDESCGGWASCNMSQQGGDGNPIGEIEKAEAVEGEIRRACVRGEADFHTTHNFYFPNEKDFKRLLFFTNIVHALICSTV